MPRMLLRSAWFLTALTVGAVGGAAVAWWWAASYTPELTDDEEV